jgi:hypothetical protein
VGQVTHALGHLGLWAWQPLPVARLTRTPQVSLEEWGRFLKVSLSPLMGFPLSALLSPLHLFPAWSRCLPERVVMQATHDEKGAKGETWLTTIMHTLSRNLGVEVQGEEVTEDLVWKVHVPFPPWVICIYRHIKRASPRPRLEGASLPFPLRSPSLPHALDSSLVGTYQLRFLATCVHMPAPGSEPSRALLCGWQALEQESQDVFQQVASLGHLSTMMDRRILLMVLPPLTNHIPPPALGAPLRPAHLWQALGEEHEALKETLESDLNEQITQEEWRGFLREMHEAGAHGGAQRLTELLLSVSPCHPPPLPAPPIRVYYMEGTH